MNFFARRPIAENMTAISGRLSVLYRPSILVITVVGILCCFVLSGCGGKAAPPSKGSEYGTTGAAAGDRWRIEYERGCSFSGAGSYRKAITAFNRAIEERDTDTWDAKTSGAKRIDYFPHRELGVVYFHRNEFSKALQELEHSVASAPSAKGAYFLNKTRAAVIERNGLDREPPELHLTGKSSREITNSLEHTVIGVATDDNYVAAIRVDDQQLMIDQSQRKSIFSHEVGLEEGDNSIRITAIDLAGKSTEKQLDIFSDRRGPQVEIEELTPEGKNIVIQGNVTDNTGIASLRINNNRWPTTEFAPGYAFKMLVPDRSITVIAKDMAGNITKAVVRNSSIDVEQAAIPQFPEPEAAYPLGPEDGNEIDTPSPLSQAAPQESADSTSPCIMLEDIGPDQETYNDTILLKGMVTDSSLLIYISINGKQILNRRGTRVFFSQLHRLDVGKNSIRVVAADEYGNTSTTTVNITRTVKNIQQLAHRMSVAILPFEQRGASPDLIQAVHENLLDSFHQQARFNIAEPDSTATRLHNKNLPGDEKITPDPNAASGNRVAPQAILRGTVIDSPGSLEIIGRLTDIKTSSVLARHDVFSEDLNPRALKSLVHKLALKFKNDIPVVEGIVLEVHDGEVLTDIGRKKHVKPHTRMICYREPPPVIHPVTGRTLESEPTILGILEIEEVNENSSRASFAGHPFDIIASDNVIVQ